MKVAIDGRWIFPKISGIGRVTEKLVFHLGRLDRDNRYLVIFSDPVVKERYQRRWAEFPNIELQAVPWSPFSPLSHLLLPGLLRRRGIDVFHSPNFLCPLFPGGPRMVVTVHDLIPLKFPHFTPRAKKTRFNFFYRWLLRRSLSRADRVIVVSNQTRLDLIDELKIEDDRIAVIYNGVDRKYRPRDKEEAREILGRKYGLSDPFFLFVGRLDPYKNVTGLIESFALFSRRVGGEVKLVIVASPDPRYPDPRLEAARLKIDSRVNFIEGVDDEDDLVAFYNGAVALVLPSLWEGFGLPPLEAMACGTPVVTSNRGALPEVVGGAALMVDPERREEIASALEKIWGDRDLRLRLQEEGLKRAATFSWDKTARQSLAVYREVFSRSR